MDKACLFAVITLPKRIISNHGYSNNRNKYQIRKTAGNPFKTQFLFNINFINSYGQSIILLSVVKRLTTVHGIGVK